MARSQSIDQTDGALRGALRAAIGALTEKGRSSILRAANAEAGLLATLHAALPVLSVGSEDAGVSGAGGSTSVSLPSGAIDDGTAVFLQLTSALAEANTRSAAAKRALATLLAQ